MNQVSQKWLGLLWAICLLGIQNVCGQGGKPVISSQPEDLIVERKLQATLTCRATGSKPITITWLHDGKPIFKNHQDNDGRRYHKPNDDLYFTRIIARRDETDAGSYQCVATNKFGSTYSRNATLIVAVLKPDFKEEPKSITVFEGKQVVLKCSPPRGRPEPVVSWNKDGVQLNVGVGRLQISPPGNLIISQVQKADAGRYVCVATNAVGKVSSEEATVTVKDQPSVALSVAPSKETVMAGQSVSFQCQYRDGPQAAITWQNAPVGRHSISQSGTLTITNVKPEDEGVYICSVGLLTANVTLTVHSPAKITGRPQDIVVREGEDAKFSCVAVGNPKPTILWENEKKLIMFPLQPRGRFKVMLNGDLKISSVQKEDGGKYKCSALTLALGGSATATLTVLGASDVLPTSVLTTPVNQTVDEQERVTMICEMSGSPTPSGIWLKNNEVQPLQNSSNVLITQSGQQLQMMIRNASLADSGIYTCEVRSPIGQDSSTARLVVNQLTTPKPPTTTPAPTTPYVLQAPTDIFVREVKSTSVQLLWSSVQQPDLSPVTYIVEQRNKDKNERWVQVVSSLKQDKYVVEDLKPNTLYVFAVRATSKGKKSTRTESASTRTKPPVVTPESNPLADVVVRVTLNVVGSSKINVTWQTSKINSAGRMHGFTAIYWREVNSHEEFQEKFIGPDKKSHVLSKLESNTTYEIQVQIVNGEHKTPRSSSRYATTLDEEAGPVVVVGPTPGNNDVRVIAASRDGTWDRVHGVVRKPWFIGTAGGVLWLILLVVVLLLYRRRMRKRQMQRQTLKTRVKFPREADPRSPVSTQGQSKTFRMDELNSSEAARLAASNRASDASSAECGPRQLNGSCCSRGGSSSPVEFSNNRMLSHPPGADRVTADGNRSLETRRVKVGNVHRHNNHYREHLNKSSKFPDYAKNGAMLNSTRSGSESTLPRSERNGPSSPYPHGYHSGGSRHRAKANNASWKNDEQLVGSDASSDASGRSKPKLKIQSFEAAGNVSNSSTFHHTEPPPTYESVLKETELEMKKFPATKGYGDAAAELPAKRRPPSPPMSERSCNTATSFSSANRRRKVLKPPPRLAIMNWAEFLPPPPVDPPPSSLGSPPPSPPFSERSAMTGISGMTGMTGMSAMTGMSGLTGTSEADRGQPKKSRTDDAEAGENGELEQATAESATGKSDKAKKPRSHKQMAIPIDLEGITSDIIMQWAESVTNTSGSEEESSCSSPSRVSGVSSDGSFFTDADFATAVRAAAECGGFNLETYGMMGIPPPYTTGYKRSNSLSNNETAHAPSPVHKRRPSAKNWETGSEGGIEYNPPTRVRPRRRIGSDNCPTGPISGAKDVPSQGPPAKAPVPIVPSQPRRPVHRPSRIVPPQNGSNPIVVQPLRRTSALGPPTKKYAVVKKIPQGKDSQGGYNSYNSMSSSKSSTSTASTVKSSSCAPTVNDDSDDESVA